MTTDQTTTTASETPTVVTPTGETPNTPPTGETPGSQTPTTPSLDDLQAQVKRMDAALKEANKQAKEYRLKASELDKLKADQEAATLTKTELLEKQLAEAKAKEEATTKQAREYKIGSEIRLQAAASGVPSKYLDKVALLITSSQVDDEGSNIKELIDALLAEMPILMDKAAATVPNVGATNPSRSSTGQAPPQEFTREYVQSILTNPVEYAKLSRADQIRIADWNRLNARTSRR